MKTSPKFQNVLLQTAVSSKFHILLFALICFFNELSASTIINNNKELHRTHGKTAIIPVKHVKKPFVTTISSFAGVPVISYSSPQAYTSGTAITPLAPVSSGVATAGYNTMQIPLASGHVFPDQTKDAAGNTYSVDYDNYTVLKTPPGGSPVVYASVSTLPTTLVVDAYGNVYVSLYYSSIIEKIPVNGGPHTFIQSGLGATSLAIDASGNIFGSGYHAPDNPLGGSLFEIQTGTGVVASVGLNIFSPGSITTDTIGNVYAEARYFVNPDSIFSGVVKIKPSGGYYISRPLPAGLTFNTATGVISGTPLNGSPATTYTITAYNSFGSSSTKLVIKVTTVLTLSYSSPQAYSAGNVITPLPPVSSGVGGLGFNQKPVTLGSGFNTPGGVAADTAGNIYVADFGNNKVKKIPAGGGTPVTIGSGFNHPAGVAVDVAGNIYVADEGNNAVKKIPSGGGAPVTIGSGFNAPASVAVDAAGNVFVADKGNNRIKKILAGGGYPIIIGSGFNAPTGVAVDAAGNIYVADNGNNAVKKIPSGGIDPVLFGTGFNHPMGIATDDVGNVYVGDSNNNAVKKFPSDGGTPVILGSGFKKPNSIAFDAVGNIYVADAGNNAVKKIKPVGGYFISSALPVGLGFNRSTGTISGTPTILSLAENYKITAYNSTDSKSAILNIAVNLPNGPYVSYTTPQVYTANRAITPLGPASNGVASLQYNSVPVTLGFGFNQPINVAVDQAGNVYVNDYSNKTIKKIPADGGEIVVIGSGFNSPNGLAVDAMGDVYISDTFNNAVKKISANGGPPVTIGSGFNNPRGLAVDAAGNVYVADFGNKVIKKIPLGQGTPVIIGTGFFHPVGIAIDADGNVYVADIGSGSIKKIIAKTGTVVPVGSGLSNPVSVAIDATGNMFVSDIGANVVKEFPVNGADPITLGSGFSAPEGVAVDGAGNVYVADYSNNAVKQIKPVGGYFIGPFLPPGLSFANETGIISGTAATATPAMNYKVTAYNGDASFSTGLNITILSKNADLASLKVSSGTLSPAFSSGVTLYTLSVTNATKSITITPTASNPTAIIQLDDIEIASGIGKSRALAVGVQELNIIVTAQTGEQKTYQLSVTRQSGALTLANAFFVKDLADSLKTADDGVLVHQAVSPNGDGIGDVLVIDKITGYPDNKVVIMNRSGVKIFEMSGYDNNFKVFSGHSNITGAMQQPGTYFYSMDYSVNGVTKHKAGYILLKY